MAFSRFFGRGRDAAPPPSDAPTEQARDEELDTTVGADDEEAPPEDADQRSWRERAEALLPTGASTGSKRFAALWGDGESDTELPTHYVSASGCRIVAVHGTPY